jgi:5-methylcytosine-specific restriction endonuclease McrBC regulatory subunit McrC
MKQTLAIAIMFLFSCTNQESEIVIEKADAVDSLIEQSNKNLDSARIIDHKSDSVTKEQVVKIVKEISYLNHEVEKYKEVLSKQTIATEKIVYKIDTIYIETKKNFWGKEKTNTTVKSDSVITEKIDTTSNNSGINQ